ncbi:MAG: type II toxin-antitoxin system Phd/YefM family antitoxin [Fretibacterium sp.]|jgi:prevent-host-death family protein|nr:type II toxin-antitoxin system Phd/YefM family antitoxin [Fretibacterium sp.]
MPNIKPVTDLQNYSDVLRDVSFGEPVFLTKEGRGCYVIVDMREYERTNATLRLMEELEKGKRSGEEKGWVPSEQVKTYFHERL